MEERTLRDAKISGSGEISGGEYNDIKISGSGKILGDSVANLIKISGSAKVLGKITTKELFVSGSSAFNDVLKGDKIKISGSAVFVKEVLSNDLIVYGVIKAQEDINAEKCVIKSEGSVIKGIYGEYIEVNSDGGKPNSIDEIEATYIIVKNCNSKRISGQEVTIGRTCRVDVVEYSTKLTIARGAKIGQIIKL